ncbi:MAG: heparinase II/III family protein, partial [Elusimicrobiota bacterium]
KAFFEDGGSSEGVGYWQYGLAPYVIFADLLYNRTNGKINLFENNKLKKIAGYPLALMLSKNAYAPFADSRENTTFIPGFIYKLAQRTCVPELRGVLDNIQNFAGRQSRLTYHLRDILWTKDSSDEMVPPLKISASYLPDLGVARIVNASSAVVIKAGNNAENHNHNDIGTYVYNVSGETVITDPGVGSYNRDYFGPKRYENLFTNSYSHPVPVIDGKLQQPGIKHIGQFVTVDLPNNKVVIEYSAAYGIPELQKLERELVLLSNGINLTSRYSFTDKNIHVLEEAFVTYNEMEIRAGKLVITGERTMTEIQCCTVLSIPVVLIVNKYEDESKQNGYNKVLKRGAFKFGGIQKVVELRFSVMVNVL